MAALETDILVQLIRAKHACLTQLRDMGRRQIELIEAGDLTALLDLLSVKQRPLADLQRVEQATRSLPRTKRRRATLAVARRSRGLCRADRAMRRAVAGDSRPGKKQRNDDGSPPRPGRRAVAGHSCGRAGPRRLCGRVTNRYSINSISFLTVRVQAMSARRLSPDPLLLDDKSDLQTVLAAWHNATVRLEQTHQSLREEVQELTKELEVKNRELARKNRLADLGQMASHVAHEVRNNLVPATLYLSLLRRRVSDDSGSLDILDKIASGLTALDVMVNDLLHFTSDRDPRVQTFSMSKLIEEVCAAVAPQLSAQAVETVIDVPRELWVAADRDMFRRAVLNMVLNAMDAMPEGGCLTITSCATPQGVELEIADTGPGLPEQVVPRIFEPFFTTKQNGTGLGLAIVSRIAEVHGGAGDCRQLPRRRRGFHATHSLPGAGGCRMMGSADENSILAPAGRVLVVDDHRQARESMADVLRQAGHGVACCASASEALQVLGRESYDCIITDLKMPGMNGLEFIVQLEQRRQPAQVVMITAHATVNSAVEAMRHGAFDYIEKPFDVDQLERLVAQAIRHGRLLQQPAGQGYAGPGGTPVMIGTSTPMQALRARIAQVAPTPETILISGESGTGKELVAKAVHAASDRSARRWSASIAPCSRRI